MTDEYKESCERISHSTGGMISPEEVYAIVKNIDINWARNLFKPLPEKECIEVTFELPMKYKLRQ